MTWQRYKIKPSERGHRPPLSDKEATKIYTICLRESVHKRLRELGSERVRIMLDRFSLSKGGDMAGRKGGTVRMGGGRKQGACGSTPKRDGSGGGVGNRGTKRAPKRK